MAVQNVDKQTYKIEQSKIIKTLLNQRYFQPWREYSKYNKDDNYNKSLNSEAKLEIYITSVCNQKCEYCYLIRHPELYPKEYNNKELILKNLKILIDWCIENNFYIPTTEFFSGEIWQSEYGLEILEIMYQEVLKGYQTDIILIPSNCSFILDPIQTQKIQRYINKFEQIDVRLCFSISVDGKIIEEYRPLNDKEKEKNDLYYENLFLFASHNNYCFHPMVASCNVNKWIDNYKWFKSMFEKYGGSIDNLMMLEVRNDDWTEGTIQSYNNFMDFLIQDKLSKCNNSSTEFFNNIFNFNNSNTFTGYVPYAITFADTFPGCTICDSLTIRLGDMAICPCHRTAYNKLLYGHFILDNDKIIDIEGNNPEIATRILIANHQLSNPRCDVCKYNKVCLRGCLGSQYEVEKDPFFPIESVCKFFESKFSHLNEVYKGLGVIEYLSNISPYSLYYLQAQNLLTYFKESI